MERRPALVVISVDVVCFAIADGQLKVLLVKRAPQTKAFAGWWALPGGTLERAEGISAAATRILQKRTGMTSPYLEQLRTFGDDPNRDPRSERSVSVAHYALLPWGEQPAIPGDDVEDVGWFAMKDLPPLAFDHATIVRHARWRLKQKVEWTPVIFRVMPELFTIGELRQVYEILTGRKEHQGNFYEKMNSRFALQPDGQRRLKGPGRPVQLYRYAGPREVPGDIETLIEEDE